MASTIQQIETPKRARALDTSGNNNHGQLYSGRALEFDGVNDYLTTSWGNGDISTPLTVACWVNSKHASEDLIFFGHGTTGTNKRIYLGVNAGVFDMGIQDSAWGTTTNEVTGFSDQPTYNINTWYRVVVVLDGSTASMYVNGIKSYAKTHTTFSPDSNFHIGDMSASGSYRWDGMLSDLQLYDAAWSADDVTYDYLNPESIVLNRGGTSLTNSNLKLWYPMQDGHRGQQSYVLDASNTGLGDEIITDGGFDVDLSNWTLVNVTGANTVTLVDGTAKITFDNTVAASSLGMQYPNAFVAGTTYKLTMDVVSIVGSGVKITDGTTAFYTGIQTGSHTFYFTAGGTTLNILRSSSGSASTTTIDNVSLKPVNDKNNATTVFYGDEFITNDPADNRTFDNDAGNWAASNSTVAWNGSYGASGGGLRVTPNGSGGSEGAKLTSGNWGSSIVLGRSYFISMDIKGHTGELDDFRFKFGNENSSTFSVTTSFATYTATVTPSTTTNSFFVEKTSNTDTNPFYIDNISVKEAGVASGWTDADQQLHIPQTALQSYNELAWFDGYADYVQLSDPYNHNLITVSAWVYVGWETSAHKCWFANRDTSEDGLLLTVSASEKLFAKFNGTTLTSSASIPTGEWTHVVYTYDDATMKLYINGEQDSNTTSFTTSDIAVTTNARIGVDSQAGKLYDFPGSITELSIWAAVLTQAEVNELYNDGKALNATIHSKAVTASTNLKGYFRNNGLSTWTDLSDDYSNNGTPSSLTETMLIPSGVDGSRDSQGFIMNRQRNTSSLNLPVNNDTADHTGPGMEARYTKDGVVDSQFGNGLGDFTVEFWFKTNQILSSSGSVLYQSAGYSAPNWSGIDIHLNNAGNVRASMYTGSSSTSVIWGDSGGSGVDYNDGNWHHVVFVVDRSTSATLIIDKVVKNIVTGTTITDHTSVVCFSGSQRVGSSTSAFQTGATTNRPAFDGQIDGLRIYNDLLTFDTDGSIAEGETVTSGEVLQNYNATKGSHRN